MNFLTWLVVGGVIGWLASVFMKTDGQQGIILNVVVGIVGAMLAGWFITPLVGIGTINQRNFSLPSLFVSFVGAAILLAIVNVARRGSLREAVPSDRSRPKLTITLGSCLRPWVS